MKLAVLISFLFSMFFASITFAEDYNTLNSYNGYTNVKLKDLAKYNLYSFQNPNKKDRRNFIRKKRLSAIQFSKVTMNPGYYWWIGRYITFGTRVNGRNRTGYILLSKNCNMRRRSIAHLYYDTWRPGQYKYFSNTRNPKKTFRCRVINITVR